MSRFFTRMLRLLCLLFCSGAMLVSCGDATTEYSNFHPNLTFDNETHLDATIATAMDPVSTGIWCHLSTTTDNGVRYFVFANNQNLSSRVIFNAIDTRLQSHLHMGMNNGLIIGFSAYGTGFYAYDAQCPKCFDYNTLPLRNYPLSVSTSAQATCSNCHATYDLNTWPNGLTRYRATTTGPFGLLRVF